MLSGGKADERAAGEKVAVFWPNQKGRGAHVNVSGAGVTAHARHRDNAIRLIEFLATPQVQRWYARVNHEYPVVEGVESSELLNNWGEFKADTINLTELGRLNADALRLMDRAGWR